MPEGEKKAARSPLRPAAMTPVTVGSRVGMPATAGRIASPAPTLDAQYPMSVKQVSNDSSQVGRSNPNERFSLAQDNTE